MAPLTPDEIDFIKYWEANRLKQKKITNQLLIGLPLGLVFALPVLLNPLSGWNKQTSVFSLNPVVAITAVVLIIVFVALFSRKHKWEMNEQHYKELLDRKETADRLQQ